MDGATGEIESSISALRKNSALYAAQTRAGARQHDAITASTFSPPDSLNSNTRRPDYLLL